MFFPYIYPLFIGAILAGACWPFFNYLQNKKLFKTDAHRAGLTTILAIIVIVLPSIFVCFQIYQELISLIKDAKDYLAEGHFENFFYGNSFWAVKIRDTLDDFNISYDPTVLRERIGVFIKTYAGVAINYFNTILGNLLKFSLDFTMALAACYVFLAYGQSLKKYLFTLSPLPRDEEELILLRFNQMNYVSLVCNGIGGIIQGVLAGIAFYFCGLPSVFLWTVIMIFLAFIPLLGISVITFPATLYLYLVQGKAVAAIVFFVITTVMALAVENWFKPKFIGNRIEAHPVFILFCIVGGLNSFGIVGVFLGPIVGTLFLTTAGLYQDKYSQVND
jgi:predicted PurR-regulated permease PerM